MVIFKPTITNSGLCNSISTNIKEHAGKLCYILMLRINSLDIFSTAITRASFTMVENGNILKKVYFPREILPISVVTSEAVNFMISTIIILTFVIFGGLGITKYVLFYPIILVVQYLLVLAISLIVSSICVYIRDLQHFIGIFIQLLFYATPVVYSAETIPENFAWVLKINPMTYIIDGYRNIFYNQTAPDVKALLILLLILIVAIAVGYVIFNKLQKDLQKNYKENLNEKYR